MKRCLALVLVLGVGFGLVGCDGGGPDDPDGSVTPMDAAVTDVWVDPVGGSPDDDAGHVEDCTG